MTEIPEHLLQRARRAQERAMAVFTSDPLTRTDMEDIMAVVLDEALSRKESAGYSGARDDGGASMLEMQVRFYRMGRDGDMPQEWEQYRHKLDPEYAEYERLKKKFERR